MQSSNRTVIGVEVVALHYQGGYKLHKFLAKDWQCAHSKIGKECILCDVSFNIFDYNANNPVDVNEQTFQEKINIVERTCLKINTLFFF